MPVGFLSDGFLAGLENHVRMAKHDVALLRGGNSRDELGEILQLTDIDRRHTHAGLTDLVGRALHQPIQRDHRFYQSNHPAPVAIEAEQGDTGDFVRA